MSWKEEYRMAFFGQRDQTLGGMSIRQPGWYEPKLAEEMQEFNPDLKNPDYIEVSSEFGSPGRSMTPRRLTLRARRRD